METYSNTKLTTPDRKISDYNQKNVLGLSEV
jgi:hypothetical protein